MRVHRRLPALQTDVMGVRRDGLDHRSGQRRTVRNWRSRLYRKSREATPWERRPAAMGPGVQPQRSRSPRHRIAVAGWASLALCPSYALTESPEKIDDPVRLSNTLPRRLPRPRNTHSKEPR